MLGDGFYNHVTAMIDCHIDHMIGKAPDLNWGREDQELSVSRQDNCAQRNLGTAVFAMWYADMQLLGTKAHPMKGCIFACRLCRTVKAAHRWSDFLACNQQLQKRKLFDSH